jgi:hypothetical protein
MHRNAIWVGLVRAITVSLALGAFVQSLTGAEATITRTNWVERWITNVIDIRMPENRFVNEYRTNWVTQFRTNIVDVYATNQVMRTLTNPIVVEATWTNYVTAYETNWNMRRLTNLIEVEASWTNVVVAHQTNWTTRMLTNRVAVNVLRTNFVDQYHTNWGTLNLTNWETVVMFKTNWITQPVTNVVQIDMPARPVATVPAAVEVVEPKAATVETASSVPGVAWAGPLTLDAARTTRPPINNLVEVLLKARWNDNTAAPLHVLSWRVEREDGAVLLFGQERDFKRQLPVGRYKVEAKVRAEGDNPPLSARGTLVVMTRDAVIQQRLLAKK